MAPTCVTCVTSSLAAAALSPVNVRRPSQLTRFVLGSLPATVSVQSVTQRYTQNRTIINLKGFGLSVSHLKAIGSSHLLLDKAHAFCNLGYTWSRSIGPSWATPCRLRQRRSSLLIVPVAARAAPGVIASETSDASETSESREKMRELITFLEEDSKNLFNDIGIDVTRYEENINFTDPITKFNSLSGYLFNIAMLRRLFQPELDVLEIKQSGDSEITTRWTMKMDFWLLPWRPTVIFTGQSIYSVNPITGRFCAHKDVWDSITDQDYFSIEGVRDLIQQLLKTSNNVPDHSNIPCYKVLKRTSSYEIRAYSAYTVAEVKLVEAVTTTAVGHNQRITTAGDGKAWNSLANYVQGKNKKRKIVMDMPPNGSTLMLTTVQKTERRDTSVPEDHDGDGGGGDLISKASSSDSIVTLQIVVSAANGTSRSHQDNFKNAINDLPEPIEEGSNLKLAEIPAGPFAAVGLGGTVTDEMIIDKEKVLRHALLKDGLMPKDEYILARYKSLNGQNVSMPFVPFGRKNDSEVLLIPLENFSLDVINMG